MRYVGVRDVDGKKYDAVEFYTADTLSGTALFDKKSGLMSGMVPKDSAQSGNVTIEFEDWNLFGASLYATRVTTRTPLGTMVMTVDSVRTDPIDPKVFELPPAIRELSSKKPPTAP